MMPVSSLQPADFDPESLERRSPAQRAVLAGFLAWGLERASSMARSHDIETLHARSDGVLIEYGWDVTRRSCFVGREHRTWLVPLDIFLSDADLADWVEQQEAKARAEAARVAALQAERTRAADAIRQEGLRRAQYEQLRQEFEPGRGPPAAP